MMFIATFDTRDEEMMMSLGDLIQTLSITHYDYDVSLKKPFIQISIKDHMFYYDMTLNTWLERN